MTELSKRIREAALDGHLLLWTCQRFDLVEGAEPHPVDRPAELVGSLYRTEPSRLDRDVVAVRWEAAWAEGARSLFARAYAEFQRRTASTRPPVVLARPDDVGASLLSSDFLAVACPYGLLDDAPSPDARYGYLPARVRQRVAWDLAGRLKLYPDRVLVVLGANTADDLELLSVAIEDNPLRGLTVMLVQPGRDAVNAISLLRVDYETFDGSIDDLLAALQAIGAPGAAERGLRRIRVGRATVELDPAVVEGVSRRFKVLTDDALVAPPVIDKDGLVAFLDGSLDALGIYASDLLPVKRAYVTDDGRSLSAEVVEAVDAVSTNRARFKLLRLPAEGGSGATTLARKAAVDAARAGIPTLILKSGQVDVDVDDLAAFLLAVNDAAEDLRIEAPPALLVFDTEHEASINPGLILRSLSMQGRRTVVLQLVAQDPAREWTTQRASEWVTLPLLSARVLDGEAEACRQTFMRLREEHDLGFLPDCTTEQWGVYERKTRYSTPSGTRSPATTFWVALRFFLVEGMDLMGAEEIRKPLREWVRRRRDALGSVVASNVMVDTVAALSWLRLACPLSTALRVSYGGAYSTEFLDVFRSLADLIEWSDRSDDLEDQTLTFRHPDIAAEFLADRGVTTVAGVVKQLTPTLEALVDSPGDRWLADTLAATVLQRGVRRQNDFDWRLDAFETIPPALRDMSGTILHHWGRVLYLAARNREPGDASRESMLKQAIRNLQRAIDVPSDGRRQERPGLIYNTLGTAHWYLAEHLAQRGAPQEEVESEWLDAAWSFEQSINQLPDNIEALLAYAYRLLLRAGVEVGSCAFRLESEAECADALGQALALLDDAKESLADYVSPDPEWQQQLVTWHHAALTTLGSPKAQEMIDDARQRGDRALAEYLVARRAILLDESAEGDKVALAGLRQAFEDDSVHLDHRALRLMQRLLRRLEPSGFDEALRVFDALARDPAYEMSLVDRFRHAVLCYQVGLHDVGAEKFRRLRAELREIQSFTPPRVESDFLRSASEPDVPAEVTLRVERVVNPLRAYGFVDELRQEVPVKPRQFPTNPSRGDIVRANIRFSIYGPFAVPPRESRSSERRRN